MTRDDETWPDGDGGDETGESGQERIAPDRFLRCWSCGRTLGGAAVRRDGIIEARYERAGGPFYRYDCPHCKAENRCEATARGTLFASPPLEPTVVDWLLGHLVPSSAETFLSIAAWREREGEKRRYVFERDGDFRYSSFFERLRWHFRRAAEEPPPPPHAEEPPHRSIPSPYAILGLAPGASPPEIKRAFLRLVRRHHPDKVHHLGPVEVRRAEERFKELMAAYEKLVGSKGSRSP